VKAVKEALLALDGVSGVGERDGELQVYLAEDTPELRARVQSIADEAGVRARLVVTGDMKSG
jgi:hypothetical protein